MWTFNNQIHHSAGLEFIGNSLCSYDNNCSNEITIYFGYRPKKDSNFKVIDSKSKMCIGETVYINIFSEDKTQWQSVGDNEEKLYLEVLHTGKIKLSFSNITMQKKTSSVQKILFCSGTLEEQNNFGRMIEKTILKNLFQMRRMESFSYK